MGIEADVWGILGRTNILLSALPALNQIDHTLGLAGSRFEHHSDEMSAKVLQFQAGNKVSFFHLR